MTITVTNSASISVPADYFGPGKEAGPNAVDAFIAAATAVGVGPMDVQVVGDPAAKKYAEEHLPQLQRKLQRNNAAVHVPKVEAAAMTKPLGHVYRESKTLPAEDAERLHWNVNESVKESGMGVRAPAKEPPTLRESERARTVDPIIRFSLASPRSSDELTKFARTIDNLLC